MRQLLNRRKQRDVVLTFCEGEAEILVFGFLKALYSNKTIDFKKPINLKGFSSFEEFRRIYYKQCKAQELKPKRDFLGVKFLFIIDSDLADSQKIIDFIIKEGHLVQPFEPNVEGMLLSLVGKKQGSNLKTEDFRKKCKNNFESYFECKAHHLKTKKMQEIFTDESLAKKHFPVLHELFNK